MVVHLQGITLDNRQGFLDGRREKVPPRPKLICCQCPVDPQGTARCHRLQEGSQRGPLGADSLLLVAFLGWLSHGQVLEFTVGG